ncbi:uncharacterized protein AB675_1464 [Cyphellophora attinorum]|uniref:Interferon-related developmental regulator N-terminal domain-containing protein n=1 Tax=Cyphellophora attinorum TaxID=1664694 RepID=A0A0N1NZ92_9EURO|nr:uncharacterized protein AB675_1464 [Phialophora attinorum]KPI37265.1 hypothetical protein AB675_1464 [Phialophora attinorum]
MHDNLRRRALESGKTTSNKAKSKQSSRTSSRAASATNSRANSRLQSRDASDDEDAAGNLSDDTNMSINSIDELLESDDINEQTTDVMREELTNSIDEILLTKGTSKNSREEFLTVYVRCLTAHLFADTLYKRVGDIIKALCRSVKAETTEKETTLALHAIALTAITIEDDHLYDQVASVLKQSISDAEHAHVKAVAIEALAACLTFGGVAEAEIEENMTYLLEIISSDGEFVNAVDEADVVAAAIHAYAFLATQVEDLEAESEDAVAALLDQLDSDSVKVQIAAGETIALLYEKSYTPREDEESSGSDDEEDEVDGGDKSLVKRYNAYHNTHQVLEKINSLSSLSTKSVGRKDRRNIHQSFASIGLTVEKPSIGLRTNKSELKIRLHNSGEMKVDTWWKMVRLNAIRRLLSGGLVNHYYEGNHQLLNVLPMVIRDTSIGSPRKHLAKATKGRHREQRRFVSVNADNFD